MATEARGKDRRRAFASSWRGVRRETDGKKWTERGDLDAPRVRRERDSLRYVGYRCDGERRRDSTGASPKRMRETGKKSSRSLVRPKTRLSASAVVVSLCDHPASGVTITRIFVVGYSDRYRGSADR